MDQWEPLESEGSTSGFVSLMLPAKGVIAVVVLGLLLRGITTVNTLAAVFVYPGFEGDPGSVDGAGLAFMMATGLIALAALGVTVITVPVWAYWHYRAAENLLILGREGVTYGPVHQVIWWFVPMLNLFMPYLAMQELYVRSQPGDEQNPPPALFGIWWACWLASSLASRFAGMLGENGVYVEAAALFVAVCAAYLYLRWVWEISMLQEQADILENV